METTKNNISPYAVYFFNHLSNYLDTKLYFFGSVQRADYFPNSSDIDVDIFSENVSSTLSKMQHFLHVRSYKFKKFVYKIHKTNKVIHGYKLQYKKPENGLYVEFSIYDEKNKEDILEEHKRKIVLPFYVSYFLILIKYFYYDLGILPKNVYIQMKKFLMNVCVDGKQAEFVVIDMSDDKDD